MTFTVTSFNAHAGLRPRPRTGGPCEPYDLEPVIKSLAADVMVVQETWWPADGRPSAVRSAGERMGAQVFELAFGRATIQPWPHPRRDGTGEGFIGLTVLTRVPSRLVGHVPFGRVLNDHTPERGGIHVEADVPGGPVDLVGIHLTSRLPYGPPIQLRRLRALLPPPSRPGVVAGDCNFWGPGVATFLPGWRRAVRGRTWPSTMPHSQIDHILVRDAPGASVHVVDATVMPNVGSDHLPVRATLRVL
jgi:endonuclease/exonuclease/phosphatase family metal-dependent hydrolase